MTKASDNPFPSLLITEGTEPSAPAAGKQRLYIDSTSHHLSRTDSSGAEVDIESAAANGLASDTLWGASGDLVVGTADNTAARLALGATGKVPRSNGSTLAYVFPPGHEFDYVERTTNVNVTGNDASPDTLLTGASVTLDGDPVLVEIYSPVVIPQATAGATLRVWLYIDGAQSGKAEAMTPVTTQAERLPFLWRQRITGLSAGAHQFIAKGSTTSGTSVFGAGGGGANFIPAFLRVTKA